MIGQARFGVKFMCAGGMIQLVANISSLITMGNVGNRLTVEVRVNFTFW